MHLLDEISAALTLVSLGSAAASQPGNGVEKGRVSCGSLEHCFFPKPPMVLPGTGRVWQLQGSFLVLEPFPPGWVPHVPSRRPADVGCSHWLLGLWVFVFPREVRWKEQDNRMLGFSSLLRRSLFTSG